VTRSLQRSLPEAPTLPLNNRCQHHAQLDTPRVAAQSATSSNVEVPCSSQNAAIESLSPSTQHRRQRRCRLLQLPQHFRHRATPHRPPRCQCHSPREHETGQHYAAFNRPAFNRPAFNHPSPPPRRLLPRHFQPHHIPLHRIPFKHPAETGFCLKMSQLVFLVLHSQFAAPQLPSCWLFDFSLSLEVVNIGFSPTSRSLPVPL